MAAHNSRHNCYCAFCKSPRRIARKKNISFSNIIASLMASVVFMFALWQRFDPRAIIVFVVCVALAEVFVKLRWRLSVPCRQCGFDPILYKKDHAEALKRVQAQLGRRREDPKYLLAKPLQLPTISPEKSQALQERAKGRLVSRSV